MPEDEYDFEGLNPGELFAVDKLAEPFDYEAQFQQEVQTKDSPPDLGGLFRLFATEYVPSRVVHLPPKVVERVSFGEHLANFFNGCLAFLIFLVLYVMIFVFLGIVAPIGMLDGFELKMHMQASARCTITAEQTDPDKSGYTPSIAVTLHTPDHRNYSTTESNPPYFNSASDEQAYFSRYQVNHTYPCWYNPANPSQVSFVKGVNLWDYIWLFLWACWFLLDGVLLNALIIWSAASTLSEQHRERRRQQSTDTSEDDASEMDLL